MSKYGGTTVNERIVLSGMNDAFNAAARDRAGMIKILARLEMSGQGAAAVADDIYILANPEKYGF